MALGEHGGVDGHLWGQGCKLITAGCTKKCRSCKKIKQRWLCLRFTAIATAKCMIFLKNIWHSFCIS